jgi:hypothetical protein
VIVMNLTRAILAAVLLLLPGACSPKDAPPPATAANPAPAPQLDSGPPVLNGLYIAKDVCPGEGCYLKGRIRAYEAADLHDKAGAGAVVRGKMAAGEWAEIESREMRLVPAIGIVREGRKHFATGDVVYRLTSDGEGCFEVWSKGEIKSWCDPDASGSAEEDEVIDFTEPPAPPPDGAGLWVKVKTDAGAEGWLHGTDQFACTGYQDRDPDCPPVQ